MKPNGKEQIVPLVSNPIAELDSLTAKLDSLIAKLDRLIAKLEIKQTVKVNIFMYI